MTDIGLEYKWKSSPNIRWPTNEHVKLYDSEGEIIHCSCGKEASTSIISAEKSVSFCSQCFEKLL